LPRYSSHPERKAAAVRRLAHIRGYRPRPLKRKYIAKSNGKQRPLSIPVIEDRARQAVHLLALSPIAETTADPNSYGFRSKRRCADAIAQCFKILRGKNSTQWVLEGDIAGFFDNIAFSWIESNVPVDRRLLSKWLRSGYMEDDTLRETTAGVPQGGLISPVIGNLTLDGMERVVKGESETFRRRHRLNFVRYADDFIVTANNREVLEQLIIPRIEAFLQERGVSLSQEKTRITHITEGFDFLGQNIRKHTNADGSLGRLQITPSAASFQNIKDKVKAQTKRYKGATPKRLIEKLNPMLRGWANYHRHNVCAETFGTLDSYVWKRLFRWGKNRHPDKTGRWIADKYFSHGQSDSWCFTDPATGKRLICIAESVKQRRYVKIRAQANPFDAEWAAYFEGRDKKLVLALTPAIMAKVHRVQDGSCPGCGQVFEHGEDLRLYHRDGNRKNYRVANLVYYHPNCYAQRYIGTDSKTESSRPSGRLSCLSRMR
jgi:RNA-directed DNA polymerase